MWELFAPHLCAGRFFFLFWFFPDIGFYTNDFFESCSWDNRDRPLSLFAIKGAFDYFSDKSIHEIDFFPVMFFGCTGKRPCKIKVVGVFSCSRIMNMQCKHIFLTSELQCCVVCRCSVKVTCCIDSFYYRKICFSHIFLCVLFYTRTGYDIYQNINVK